MALPAKHPSPTRPRSARFAAIGALAVAALGGGGAIAASAMAAETESTYVTVVDGNGDPLEAPLQIDTPLESADDGRDCSGKSGDAAGPSQAGSAAPAPVGAPQAGAATDRSAL